MKQLSAVYSEFINRKNLMLITLIFQREIKDIKKFVELARRKDVKSATIKGNNKIGANGKVFKQTKFKIRGTRYLYTLVVNDSDKASKLVQSLPPNLTINDLNA